ncbi:MAG: hypothetical protein MZU91_11230 [Desulfosudis oleivorans]|nr:hypothetical protein [Desulfosudis oleivorans]
MGVAATKAADLIKDSWRKRIEVARLETEVKIKTAFLELKKDRAAQAEGRYSLGLVGEDEALVAKLGAERAAADREMSVLDLEEAKASGEAPRNELYAPLVDGRDFVGERLGIEKKVLQADLDLRRARTEPALRHRVELGLAPKSALSEFAAALAGQEAGLEDIENRLASTAAVPCGRDLSRGDGDPDPHKRGAERTARSPIVDRVLSGRASKTSGPKPPSAWSRSTSSKDGSSE